MCGDGVNRIFILLVALVCVNRSVLAETLTGVLSDDGEPVRRAAVSLVDADGNILVKKTHTDNAGQYEFTVKPGDYKLRASKDEYAVKWIKGITVSGADVRVDIIMTPQVFIDSTVVPESDGCD